MPKQYGSPTGTEKPKNKDRTQPKAGSAKSYLEHMNEAHKAYETSQKGPSTPVQPPKGRGGTQMGRDILGIGKAKSDRRTDEALDDAGA